MKKIFLLVFAGLIVFISSGHAQYNTSQVQPATTQAGLLNGAAVFTVEFWVKTTENKGNDIYWQRPYLFGNETNGDNSGDFGITTNFGYIGMWDGISTLNTDQQFLSNSIRVNDNRWHDIAAVDNGQTINLYVDGNIIGSLIAGRQLITTNAPLTFGAASLDHSFAGNVQNNVNFASQASFGEAIISNNARYSSNFIPSQSFPPDANAVAVFHFDKQNYNTNSYNTQPTNPNEPVIFDPSEAINDNAAQPATLYLSDSVGINGRLLLGKKDWSLSNEIYIRFFEGNSKKVKYYKPEEIKGFQMGDSYYEPKFLGPGGAVSTPFTKTMVKRLTPAGSKMGFYVYDNHTTAKNASGIAEYKKIHVHFVQLPNTTDDKVYQFSDNKFSPNFDKKVSNMVADKPELAEKIRSKNKDYFYAFVTEDIHQYRVWINIISEYNKP